MGGSSGDDSDAPLRALFDRARTATDAADAANPTTSEGRAAVEVGEGGEGGAARRLASERAADPPPLHPSLL